MKDSTAAAPHSSYIKSVIHRLLPAASLTLTVLCSALLLTSTLPAIAATGESPLYLTAILDSPQNEAIDGPAPAARTGFLKTMVSDSQGNLYFSDGTSHAVRQLSTNGIVRTLTDEVLFNINFMAVDTNEQLYFLQVFDLFRGNPRWEMKRLHNDGTTELVTTGTGNPFGMQHDLHDGFYVHINRSRYGDIHHEILRVSTTGQQEVIYDSQVAQFAPQRPLTQINGMVVDHNGTLVVLDNLMLRRVYNNGVLEDIASFSPSVGTLGRDITLTPSGQVVLCTQQQVSIWDLSTYQLVYVIGDAAYNPPTDNHTPLFTTIMQCESDAQGNIHVTHMNGFDHHTVYRIHAEPDALQFPALQDESAFEQMLQHYAAGATFTVDRSGVVYVQIDEYNYPLIADDVINNGSPEQPTGVHELADQNGDGLSDFLLVYPDRTQQGLYLMKPEELPLQQ